MGDEDEAQAGMFGRMGGADVYVDGRRVRGAAVLLTADDGATHEEHADAGDLASGMLDDWLSMGGFDLAGFKGCGGVRVDYTFEYGED